MYFFSQKPVPICVTKPCIQIQRHCQLEENLYTYKKIQSLRSLISLKHSLGPNQRHMIFIFFGLIQIPLTTWKKRKNLSAKGNKWFQHEIKNKPVRFPR